MPYNSEVNSINLSKISKSVGRGGANLPLDVLVIQRLLNGCKKQYSGKALLVSDGLYGAKTQKQIGYFQREMMGFKFPDCLISVGKNTHKKLVENLSPEYHRGQIDHAAFAQKGRVDTARLVNLWSKQYPAERNKGSLKSLVAQIMGDPAITDIRWVAYMLATVQRECGGTWQPIREWGKGKRFAYGKEVDVVDPTTKKVKKNIYYGRGYVQLTWDYNYKKVGKMLGLDNLLYVDPDEALKEDIAYKIMSLGMRQGIFSGARLVQYLSGDRTDYVGARRIINGTDHAVEIADLAVKYEALLMASSAKNIIMEVNTQRYANYA